MTLEDYFRQNALRTDVNGYGVIDFAVRVEVFGPVVTFYIHPANAGGDTPKFLVSGNDLERMF